MAAAGAVDEAVAVDPEAMVREGIEDVAGRRRQAGDEFRGESRHAPIGEETGDAPDGLILEIGNALAPLRVGFMRVADGAQHFHRSEEHTSELQSLMRISYAVFCLK